MEVPTRVVATEVASLSMATAVGKVAITVGTGEVLSPAMSQVCLTTEAIALAMDQATEAATDQLTGEKERQISIKTCAVEFGLLKSNLKTHFFTFPLDS